jgi:hypothetical protein
MYGMFNGCKNFNQPLDSWGPSLINVTDMNYMFGFCVNLNQSFANWNINANADIGDMFYDTSLMQETNYPPRIQEQLLQGSETNSESLDDDIDDDIDDNIHDLAIQIYQQTNSIPIINSELTILPTATAYNMLSLADENVLDYLNENTNENIVFKFNNHYHFITKETILSMINDGSAIKYGCRNVDTSLVPRSENLFDEPCFDLNKIGIPSGLVYLGKMKSLLEGQNQAYEIVNKEPTLIYPSTASLQMLSSNPNAVSASHCQEGQQATVYDLKSINIATTGGKKRKTRKTSKTKKTKKIQITRKNRKTIKTRKTRKTRK